MLLGVARELLQRGVVDQELVRRWVNWREYLEANVETSEPARDVAPQLVSRL